jgi:hypothetical protein
MSTTVRIPQDIDAPVKAIAAMQGRVAGEVLADAWREYFENHREEFAAEFERAAEVVRAGDTDAMAALMNRFNDERAVDAAEQARTP